MGIKENMARVRACAGGATLIAVTKGVEAERVMEAIEAGVTDIGENKVQEAKNKRQIIKDRFPNVRWHMIGHLQANKVKAALEIFDVIQSVDTIDLAREISKRALKPVEVFIEVNTSGESSKFGEDPQAVGELAALVSGLPNLKLTGLMTMGPLTDDKEKIKGAFRLLKEIRDRLRTNGYPGIKHLSMGMSDDFPLAIEEGSDIIRIGRGIFKV